MKKAIIFPVVLLVFLSIFQKGNAEENRAQKYPIGNPGIRMTYSLEGDELPQSVVRKFELIVGAVEEDSGTLSQWFQLDAEKENKQRFTVWILASAYPSASLCIGKKETLRYIFSEVDLLPVEFVDQGDGTPILPTSGVWEYLLPRTEDGGSPLLPLAERVKYLGQEYVLERKEQGSILQVPRETMTISLTPDLLIGVPHNSKVKDETRRYDESDYEYVEFTRANYREMIKNGMNVFNVNAKQVKWIKQENIYYWGIGGDDISYPEDLYRSNYIGPAIFFDEPMVHVRDQVLRPKFKEDPTLRKRITPEIYFEEFKKEYHEAQQERSTTQFIKGLAQRDDVALGDMEFLQQNVYSWETMISSSLYQLSEGNGAPPAAIVFEPPGRFGAKRVLPELNMCFECQIPVSSPKNLLGIIMGFVRGAARVTDKEWGISIYGAVLRSEAYWLMTHAYEQGGTHFFFWDSYELAAVPYGEYLSLSRNLRDHAKRFPRHNLKRINRDAETAIVLPVGYNLGHVKMGIGNFSGLPELNMERRNELGVKYRDVMNNFYIEIERCIRLGVEYDLFWNLDGLELDGYREIVLIRKDGNIEVLQDGNRTVLESARIPERPEGDPPQLSVAVEIERKEDSNWVRALAQVSEGDAPIYYTQGANKDGIYRNTYVLWELYGPEEEDYTDFWKDRWDIQVVEEGDSAAVAIDFQINKPGAYRLRVSACDAAGRSTVVWNNIHIEK